jgi:uncharacterized coiled-coil DUF342 family protein
MWAAINSDKYKNFTDFEEQDQLWQEKFDKLTKEVKSKDNTLELQSISLKKVQEELEQLKNDLATSAEKEDAQETITKNLQEKCSRQQAQIDHMSELQKATTDFVDELKQENQKLKNDVTWLANSAKHSKIQSEKAISDLEEYAQILKKMEEKLLQTEKQRDIKTQECMDLQGCVQKLMNSMPQATKGQQSTYHQHAPQPTPAPQRFEIYPEK